MLRFIKIILLSLCCAVMISCGTGKKLEAAQSAVSELRDQNNELAREAEILNSEVKALAAQKADLQKQHDSYKKQCEETQQELSQVNNILDEEAETMDKVEQKLEEALKEFNSRGLDVYSQQGLVYVSLPDELLYKSGSSKLGNDGQKALASLAAVLNDHPNLKVIVLGNTANLPLKKGSDNWSLSTERANGVVRMLRDKYKVDPSRLTSAGKGKYNPVADNGTVEGRAKNRRTDIILNPNIERIWETARNEKP